MPNQHNNHNQSGQLAKFWTDVPVEIQSLSLSFLPAKELFNTICKVQKDGRRWEGEIDWQQRVLYALFTRSDQDAIHYQAEWLHNALKQADEQTNAYIEWVCDQFTNTLQNNAVNSVYLRLAYIGAKLRVRKGASINELQFAEACLQDMNFNPYIHPHLQGIFAEARIFNLPTFITHQFIANNLNINVQLNTELFNEVLQTSDNLDMATKLLTASGWNDILNLVQSYVKQNQELNLISWVIHKIMDSKLETDDADEAIELYQQLSKNLNPYLQLVGYYGLARFKNMDIPTELELINYMKETFENNHSRWSRKVACQALGRLLPRVAHWAETTLAADSSVEVNRPLLTIAYEAASVSAQVKNAIAQRINSTDNDEIRSTACYELSRITKTGDQQALDQLIPALGDISPHVRMAAAYSLGHLATKNNNPIIQDLFNVAVNDIDPGVIRSAYASLGFLVSPEDNDSITQLRQSAENASANNDQQLFKTIESALTQMGGQYAYQAIFQLKEAGYQVSNDSVKRAYTGLLEIYNRTKDAALLTEIRGYCRNLPNYDDKEVIDWNKLNYNQQTAEYKIISNCYSELINTQRVADSITTGPRGEQSPAGDELRPRCCNIL